MGRTILAVNRLFFFQGGIPAAFRFIRLWITVLHRTPARTCSGLAALQVLAVVKKLDQPVSKVCHRFEPLPQIMKNVRYKSGKPLENAKVVSAISAAEKKLNGQGRLVIRPSGTEPVLRVMVEGEDLAATEQLAQQLALGLQLLFQSGQRDLRIALLGDLGAGKTTFTRYLLKALGYTGKVKSPTYALCEPYEIRINQHLIGLHHFDMYRIKSETEALDFGIENYLYSGYYCFIEWPQLIPGLIPDDALKINIVETNGERTITLSE